MRDCDTCPHQTPFVLSSAAQAGFPKGGLMRKEKKMVVQIEIRWLPSVDKIMIVRSDGIFDFSDFIIVTVGWKHISSIYLISSIQTISGSLSLMLDIL